MVAQLVGWSRSMLYSGFNILPRSVFWSADLNVRSDNADVMSLVSRTSIPRTNFVLQKFITGVPMRIVDKIEAAVQLISALLGAFVFTLGVGSATVGGLRLSGIRWNAIWAYPIVFTISIMACVFARLFFMRFAIPIVALFSDELGSDDSPYSFTPLQGLMSFALIASLVALIIFAFIPSLKLVGIIGAIGFLTFIVWSKSLTDCYKQQSPVQTEQTRDTERDITNKHLTSRSDVGT